MYVPSYGDGDRISIVEADGTTKSWIRLAARVREFNKTYTKEAGYKVRVSPLTMAEILGVEVMDLYAKVLSQGISCEKASLTPLRTRERVFRAQLLDAADNVVAEASACGIVANYKDHEKIESAAFQRLLAFIGFPGSEDELDGDEARDMADQNLATVDSKGNTVKKTEAESMSDPVSAGQTDLELPVADEASDQDNGTSQSAPNVVKITGKEKDASARQPPSKAPAWKGGARKGMDPDEALSRQVQQVQRAYAARGMTAPTIQSKEDAATAMRALTARPDEAAAADGG